MRPPPVVIAANPYEGELCRRALADTGLEVELAEDREHAHQLIAAARPLVVVVASGWVHGDAADLLGELRAMGAQSVPIFLLGDREGPIADEDAAVRAGATRLFLRPIEVDALADAIEKLAVEDELASEVSEQLESVSAPGTNGPALEMEADFGEEWQEPVLTPSRAPTEVLPPSAVAPPIAEMIPVEDQLTMRPPASASLPRVELDERGPLLRADDVLAEAAGLRIQTLATSGGGDFVPRPPELPPPDDRDVAGYADRSPFARGLDRQLSEVERRLFPDAPARDPRSRYGDYDDALGDIDLDTLGIDTLPGIAADSLDSTFDTRPERARGATPPPAPTTPPSPSPSTELERAELRDGASSRSRLAFERGGSDAGAPPVPEEEGELGHTDIAELLSGLHAAGWSGRVALSRGDGEKAIFFDAGQPVFATSSFQTDRLGDLLFREGKLTREQHARTRELAVEPGRRTASVLMELGLVKQRELFPTLRRHVEEILFSCFAWDSGGYRLTAEQAPAEDKLRLSAHPWALFVEGVRRKYGLERLVERVGPPETVLTPTTGLERALADCELTSAERVVAEMFDGERSLADLGLATNGLPGATLSETGLYALAWGLCAVGAARIGAQGLDRIGVRAAATLVTPLGGQAARERRRGGREDPSDRPSERAIDRERLLAKRAQIADADYFAILGVDRAASAHEIERAFERLRLDFAPERFGETVRAELADALAEIREVLDEAHRVLRDEAVRTAYREHLVPAE